MTLSYPIDPIALAVAADAVGRELKAQETSGAFDDLGEDGSNRAIAEEALAAYFGQRLQAAPVLAALATAAAQFRLYERDHRAKAGEPPKTPDRAQLEQYGERLAKAERNREMADLCEAALARSSQPLQARVGPWMLECFGAEIAADLRERCDRFIEEAFELVQSLGYDRTRLRTLEAYVYGRPSGQPGQEVGGVMITLAALCGAAGLDMHAEGDREMARISEPETILRIRAKQASKRGLHGPLPVPPEGEIA